MKYFVLKERDTGQGVFSCLLSIEDNTISCIKGKFLNNGKRDVISMAIESSINREKFKLLYINFSIIDENGVLSENWHSASFKFCGDSKIENISHGYETIESFDDLDSAKLFYNIVA